LAAGDWKRNEHPPGFRAAEAMSEDLPFKVVRSNGTDEVARPCDEPADRSQSLSGGCIYPDDLIELRQGARLIERSK
jgi:hypothetical protein